VESELAVFVDFYAQKKQKRNVQVSGRVFFRQRQIGDGASSPPAKSMGLGSTASLQGCSRSPYQA
jgi:hypothetical protein